MSQTLQYVLSRLPALEIEEEDFEKYPQFRKLMLAVCQRVELSGQSVGLNKDMEEARMELRLQRKAWLRLEVIYRLVQEILMELHVQKQDGTLNAEDSKLREGLHKCMLASECACMLLSDITSPDHSTSLLGLHHRDLIEFLPTHMYILWTRDRLHKYLEEALRKKCFAFLSYHQPETDEESDVLRAAKALRLASTLEDEKRRLQNEQEKFKEMSALLERQREMYPQVLLRCLTLLRQAASELRLKAQSDIDHTNAEYLEAKSNALFLKLRMEELQVLTESYTPEKIEVHKQIKDTIDNELKKERQEMSTSQQILMSYEFLGPEFEELVQEYTRLREKITENHWMLQELSKTLS